ncbi:MAG: hypothetical protein ACYCTG_13625 [Ferrimicrobium sp.]
MPLTRLARTTAGSHRPDGALDLGKPATAPQEGLRIFLSAGLAGTELFVAAALPETLATA